MRKPEWLLRAHRNLKNKGKHCHVFFNVECEIQYLRAKDRDRVIGRTKKDIMGVYVSDWSISGINAVSDVKSVEMDWKEELLTEKF